MEDKQPYDVELPQSVIEEYARFLVPELRRWYESEAGKQAFIEWQKEHEKDTQ